MDTNPLFTFVLVGVLFIALSVPMVQRMVKPNPWYGFRTPQTLSNPHLWYEVNAYCGNLLLGLGVVLALVAIILARVPGINTETSSGICLIITLGGVFGSILLSFRYLRSLSE